MRLTEKPVLILSDAPNICADTMASSNQFRRIYFCGTTPIPKQASSLWEYRADVIDTMEALRQEDTEIICASMTLSSTLLTPNMSSNYGNSAFVIGNLNSKHRKAASRCIHVRSPTKTPSLDEIIGAVHQHLSDLGEIRAILRRYAF